MLRQVLTAPELAELGLDAAVLTLPQPEMVMTFQFYTTLRRFLVTTFVLMWSLMFYMYISSGWLTIILPNAPLTFLFTSSITFTFLFFYEFTIGSKLTEGSLSSKWDLVALVLGVGSKITCILDMYMPIYAWRRNCTTVAVIASLTCSIVYVGLVGIQQGRIILALYSLSDNYAIQNLESFFVRKPKLSKFPWLPLQFFYLWSARKRKSLKSSVNTLLLPQNAPCESSGSIELNNDMNKFAEAVQQGKIYIRDIKDEKVKMSANSLINYATDDNEQNHSTNGTCFSLHSLQTPPSFQDAFIYSFSYMMTINMIKAFNWLEAERHWPAMYHRITLFLPRSLRRARRPQIGSYQQPLTLLTSLNPAANARNSYQDIKHLWIRNYHEQQQSIVDDHKLTQLVNASHLLDAYFIQSILKRRFIAPDCLEAHEFSVAITSIGRCFIGDFILILFKCYLLTARGSSAYIVASLFLSIFLSACVCMYNTIDEELWQDFLAVD